MTKAIKCYTEHKSGKYAGCTAPHIHEVKVKQIKLVKDIEDFLEDYEQKEEMSGEDNVLFLADAVELLCKVLEKLIKQ